MEILGIGPLELFFVIVIALIILGPKDIQKTGKIMGKWLNTLVKSDTWKLVRQTSNKIKYLPNELMREAGIDEIKKLGKDINQDFNKGNSDQVDDPFIAWKKQHPNLYPTLKESGEEENISEVIPGRESSEGTQETEHSSGLPNE